MPYPLLCRPFRANRLEVIWLFRPFVANSLHMSSCVAFFNKVNLLTVNGKKM